MNPASLPNISQHSKQPPEKELDFTDPTLTYSHVLYIHNASEPAVELRKKVRTSLSDKVYLQDVTSLGDYSSVEWLDGVPILVNKKTGDVYKGTQAFLEIDRIISVEPKKAFPGLKSTI